MPMFWPRRPKVWSRYCLLAPSFDGTASPPRSKNKGLRFVTMSCHMQFLKSLLRRRCFDFVYRETFLGLTFGSLISNKNSYYIQVSENRVLRRTFVPKRREVI